PGAIPWLRLDVVGSEDAPTGGHKLTSAVFIHRLNTIGGGAPLTGCALSTDVGKKASVPYSADYFFYEGHSSQGSVHMKPRPLQYIDFRRPSVGASFFTVGPLVELSRYRDRRPESQRNVHREQLHRVSYFVTNNSHDQIVFGRGSSVPSSY